MNLPPSFTKLFANRKNAKVPQIETAKAVVAMCNEKINENPHLDAYRLNVLDVINKYPDKPYDRYTAQISRVLEIFSHNGYARDYKYDPLKRYPYVSTAITVDLNRIKAILK